MWLITDQGNYWEVMDEHYIDCAYQSTEDHDEFITFMFGA